MDSRIISCICCAGLLFGWGFLVWDGKADAAPLITFIQTAAYTALGLAAHGYATKGFSNAKKDTGADAQFISGGMRLPAVNREPPATPATADPAEPG